MEGVRGAIARIDAIRTTIQGPQRAPETPEASFETLLHAAVNRPERVGAGYPTRWLGSASPTGAPAGLEMYQNGLIPLTALLPVSGTDEHLWAPAAHSFEAMRAQAAREGIELPVIDGYRPIHDQERLAEELGLYRDGGLAAVPGTSQHGWGRAVDLDLDDRALAWMRANAGRFGFAETVPREPWHWEYHPQAHLVARA
jgi:hypothetical protein